MHHFSLSLSLSLSLFVFWLSMCVSFGSLWVLDVKVSSTFCLSLGPRKYSLLLFSVKTVKETRSFLRRARVSLSFSFILLRLFYLHTHTTHKHPYTHTLFLFPFSFCKEGLVGCVLFFPSSFSECFCAVLVVTTAFHNEAHMYGAL